MNTQQYFKEIEKQTKRVYEIAERARAKGYDPVANVEIPLARSLAEKVVGLISAVYPQMEGSGIIQRILELENQYGKLDTMVSFMIAEEIAKQKFCKFSSLLEAIEAGIRVGFAYITLGVVSSPIEGFTGLELGKTKEGKDYFIAFFSGPIRSAGTTASCLGLMLIDYLRELFGYDKYDATQEEINRYVIENQDYHERVTNLQYMPTKEEIMFLAKNLPIQIDGEPTEELEVSNYKNLPRIVTNYIRGGMCLIFSEGLSQKAAKGLRLLKRMKAKGLVSTGFDFLEEYCRIHAQRDKGIISASPTYINDLVAGRPIFGHPSRSGSFRFRYGRGRDSGFSATSIHPATMGITDGFIAIGTQLKLEKPTKGCIVTSCDSIDGPIVKLYNGSVRKINTLEDAKKLYPDVEEIIYLGDILVPFSDVVNRNSQLLKPGYVEEIWKLELQEKNQEFGKTVNVFDINIDDAIKISKEFNVPTHPSHIFFWSQINLEQFLNLLDWLELSKFNNKIILPFTKKDQEKFKQGKRALELLAVEHDFLIENVIIGQERSKAFLVNLGINFELINTDINLKEEIQKIKGKIKEIVGTEKNKENEFDVLSLVNYLCEFKIKDKAGDFIGARMGRPEKAKIRKLTGSPNVIFPVGWEGGRLRSVITACNVGKVSGDFPSYYCKKCQRETIYGICEICDSKCEPLFYCPECKRADEKLCQIHHVSKKSYYKQIDINHYLNKAAEKLGIVKSEIPLLIKGVRGTSSKNHSVENLVKGVIRAKYNLQVNKDGTIRFDATEMPLVSFKPKEISVSVEKLKKLGYATDIKGNALESEYQILELKPHDIILPSPLDVPEARADEVFMRISHFIDELLEKFYGVGKVHDIKKKEDLIGELGVCIAPHNCAGVVCRFIGFSNTLGMFASPYMHAAVRRDCDGDEVAIMLLSDVLLNFSREFLPSHRGGTQDSPLVLNAKIDAGEVDEQILDFELLKGCESYPLELYQAAEQGKHSSEVKIYDVRTAIKQGNNPFENIGYTHETSNINAGVVCSSYKLLVTMQEKVQRQMGLVEKIRAVDTQDTAKLVIEKHFLKDIRGNLRKFSVQGFRCVACNEIMRRPPLSGKCLKCGGKIIFTTNEGGIKKYLDTALELAKKYNLSKYINQNLELTKRHVDSIFGKEAEKQEGLGKWF